VWRYTPTLHTSQLWNLYETVYYHTVSETTLHQDPNPDHTVIMFLSFVRFSYVPYFSSQLFLVSSSLLFSASVAQRPAQFY